MTTRFYLICLVILLQGCVSVDHKANPGSAAAELQQARALMGPDWPGSNSRLTTSGDIYMANLNAQLQSLQALFLRQPNDVLLVQLASALYHRFQIVGRLADAERARALVAGAYGSDHSADVDLLYAEILLGFHEFALAEKVLATAVSNEAGSSEVTPLRWRIRHATGKEVAPQDPNDRSPVALANRANVLFEQGEFLTASRMLQEAQDNYRNTAPYLLSWIQTQQGIFFLRHGDYASARSFFAAARGRLPQYAIALEHLAETEFALGNRRIAAELYRSVAQQTDNPEFYYQLSQVEHALGNLSAASRFAKLAAASYADLVRRYPLMYADHAARYYLAEGDVARSLQLAQANLAARQDYSARVLLVEIYAAMQDTAAACTQLKRLRAAGFVTPEMKTLSASLNTRCN